MEQKTLKIDDLNPDGLRITVNWEDMSVAASIFVPCVNTEKAKGQINKIAKRKEWAFETQVCIEAGKLGLRAWRTM